MVAGTDEQTQPKFKRIPKVGKGSGVLDERGVSNDKFFKGNCGYGRFRDIASEGALRRIFTVAFPISSPCGRL